MLLSARPLINVTDVNTWEVTDSIRFTEGDSTFIYFQLIDLNKDRTEQGYKPSGKRYMPATGATLQVTIQNIDSAKTLVKTASQPYANDPSMWRIQIASTDVIKGTNSLQLALTESGVITRGTAQNVISVISQTSSFC